MVALCRRHRQNCKGSNSAQ